MQCPHCLADNPDTATFCSRCTTRFSRGDQRGGPSDGDHSTPEAADRPTTSVAGPAGGLHDELPHALATAHLVGGKYEIAQELGRGGMGVVYKARDLPLQRWVALKFLPPRLAAFEDMRERFLVEARAAAALSHPNICVIHEVGEDAGQPFIAMEYVEGEPLHRKIQREALGFDEIVALFIQVAAGLEEAHRKGIVHRDIKSSNIMVTGQGQAKIMDFGLAKLQGGPALTKTGTTLGTVAYMSPEQASGDEVDHRSDLWSAGVVLYELLTGELPFQGDREVAVVHAILHEDPRPLRGRTPPIPAALEQVVAKALKKTPEARYGSASAMLADLRAYEEARRAEAAGVLSVRALARRLRRPRVAIPAAAATVALAVAAVWFVQHRAQVRWAREVALPEIERLIGENDVWRNLVPPYRLAVQAEAVLGNDPKLAELFSKVSLNIDIRTEPSGARAFMKEYGTPDAEWTELGVTPIEKVRVPIGIFRWKLEKEGYETVLAAASTWNVGRPQDKVGVVSPAHLVRTLDKVGSLRPGMVRVPATDTPVGRLEDFFIGRYEVTNREYKGFIDAGGYRNREYWKQPFLKDGHELSWDEAMKALVDPSGQPGPATWQGGDYPEGQADYPVSGVSWYEAAAYAEYAGMSLPTSTHWNVARGGLTPMVQVPQLGGFAVLAPFSNFSGRGTVAVGNLPGVTAYGAYDMAGNVREWCWNEAPAGRVVRGGAWEDNTYEFGNQRQAPAMDRSDRNGLRLALYPDPDKVPEKALAFVRPAAPPDIRAQQPVSDETFKVYRERFAYDKTDLNATVESREESPGGWIREKVSFDAAYGGERVAAYLFLPSTSQPPYQTVIYFPGSAVTRTPSSQDLESYYEFPMFLSFLVKNGRAVLFPVYKGTFERSDPALAAIHAGAGTHAYTEFLVQLVKDFRRCIDYLETRTDIDRRKIAYYGMSWGGALGALIPAVEERLATSVLVAGGGGSANRPEAYVLNYVTRVRVPTLMLNGKYDRAVDTRVKPTYELLGTPAEDKRLVLFETDHIPPRNEYIRETLAWLDKYLGPVRR